MILIALEHVERFTESQNAHNVERLKIEQLRYVNWALTGLADGTKQLLGEVLQAGIIIA